MPPYDTEYPDILDNLPDSDFANFSLDFLNTNFMKQQWSEVVFVPHSLLGTVTVIWKVGKLQLSNSSVLLCIEK